MLKRSIEVRMRINHELFEGPPVDQASNEVRQKDLYCSLRSSQLIDVLARSTETQGQCFLLS